MGPSVATDKLCVSGKRLFSRSRRDVDERPGAPLPHSHVPDLEETT